jgi:nucleotide-binding universal stress UspA family protein
VSSVIAALDDSAAAEPVIAVAIRLAELYNCALRAVHVREDGSEAASAAARVANVTLESVTGSPVDRLITAASEPDVRAMVLGARGRRGGRRPAGSTALALITAISGKPVVVVPPDVSHPGRIDRVLVPLDGSRASAVALAGTINLARQSGLETVVLHVREEGQLPRFSDHLQHEARTWAEEFIARNCPCPPEEVQLELRVGMPHEHVVQVARSSGVDLLALGWSQDISAGRAAVVREALARSPVPILLLPVEEQSR